MMIGTQGERAFTRLLMRLPVRDGPNISRASIILRYCFTCFRAPDASGGRHTTER
jgi:hypothetical protein